MSKGNTFVKKDKHSTEKLGYRATTRKNGAGMFNWGKYGDEIEEFEYTSKNGTAYRK